MTKAALSIGSNLGNRFNYLQAAVTALAEHPSIFGLVSSSIYETKPIGGPEQDDFFNAVLVLETNLTALELLDLVQNIELAAQRKREIKWGPRTLDIDILTFGTDQISTEKLNVPHPQLSSRAFVLVPWFEIDPTAEVSGLGKLVDLVDAVSKTDVRLNGQMKLVVY
jgi:2-amino-4-hydroxy-6-hydroxymethyldihydropteridine diphosphokinase